MRVLIVEDDLVLQDGLSVGLNSAGFSSEVADCLDDARAALTAGGYDGVVLDSRLPHSICMLQRNADVRQRPQNLNKLRRVLGLAPADLRMDRLLRAKKIDD